MYVFRECKCEGVSSESTVDDRQTSGGDGAKHEVGRAASSPKVINK